MKTEWRPKEGWGNNVDCDCPFFSDSTGDPINCSQRPNDCEAGASAMLVARDKEWVEWVEKMIRDCCSGKCKLRATCSNLVFSCELLLQRKKEINQ